MYSVYTLIDWTFHRFYVYSKYSLMNGYYFIILLLFVITFMRGIYKYIPEKPMSLGCKEMQLFCICSSNYIKCYFVVLNTFVLLHNHFSRYVYSAQTGCVCVCVCAFIALILCFPTMFLTYVANYFQTVPGAPVITSTV
jgi:hypothetical protein